MTNTARDYAMRKLREAQEEVRKWTEFIALYDSAGSPKPSRHKYAGPIMIATRNLTREILSHQKYMKTSDLLEALIDAGDDIGGKNPKATLCARLQDTPDIKLMPKKGWYLVTQEAETKADVMTLDDNHNKMTFTTTSKWNP